MQIARVNCKPDEQRENWDVLLKRGASTLGEYAEVFIAGYVRILRTKEESELALFVALTNFIEWCPVRFERRLVS
jgi:hypothetical protein